MERKLFKYASHQQQKLYSLRFYELTHVASSDTTLSLFQTVPSMESVEMILLSMKQDVYILVSLVRHRRREVKFVDNGQTSGRLYHGLLLRLIQ